jgi:hypothetical protein
MKTETTIQGLTASLQAARAAKKYWLCTNHGEFA